MSTAATEITWKHQLDDQLKEAGRQKKQVLLDFTAAPM
jgi:hypothetical protein